MPLRRYTKLWKNNQVTILIKTDLKYMIDLLISDPFVSSLFGIAFFSKINSINVQLTIKHFNFCFSFLL